ncbi:MAG: PDZ domain-containing protein [Elusimicrobia bacterium]|nr:PDZ domain-containing protein [Elusimicrobiota bacterium]
MALIRVKSILFLGTSILVIMSGCAANRPLLHRGWIGGEYETAKKPFIKMPPSLKDERELVPALPDEIKKNQKGAVIVTKITENTPAGEAGIKEGDLILKLQGRKIKNVRVLRKMVDSVIPGQTLVLTIYRNGEINEYPVTAGKESFKKMKYFYIGFRLSPYMDIFPDPDFSIFSIVSYKENSGRMLLNSPVSQYVLKNSNYKNYANNPIWDLWLGIFGFGGSESIISQEVVKVGKK